MKRNWFALLLVLGLVPTSPPAHAATTVPVAPPFDVAFHEAREFWAPIPTPHYYEGTSNADATTGRVTFETSLSGPAGLHPCLDRFNCIGYQIIPVANAAAVAQGHLDATFTLASEASSIDLVVDLGGSARALAAGAFAYARIGGAISAHAVDSSAEESFTLVDLSYADRVLVGGAGTFDGPRSFHLAIEPAPGRDSISPGPVRIRIGLFGFSRTHGGAVHVSADLTITSVVATIHGYDPGLR